MWRDVSPEYSFSVSNVSDNTAGAYIKLKNSWKDIVVTLQMGAENKVIRRASVFYDTFSFLAVPRAASIRFEI